MTLKQLPLYTVLMIFFMEGFMNFLTLGMRYCGIIDNVAYRSTDYEVKWEIPAKE